MMGTKKIRLRAQSGTDRQRERVFAISLGKSLVGQAKGGLLESKNVIAG
jgi:hypothetical protein